MGIGTLENCMEIYVSQKWLSTALDLIRSLVSWGLCTLNILLVLGLINLRICFLNKKSIVSH